MKRSDLFALLIVLIVLLGLPAGLFGYQAWRAASAGVKIVEIVARAPEQGGFSPDRLSLQAGETVRLRISSPDVVHGLTIPGLGVTYHEVKRGATPETAPTFIKGEVLKREDATMQKYRCLVCNYIYDPALGDPDNGVPAGTLFEKIPDSWVCPVCGADKSQFVKEG